MVAVLFELWLLALCFIHSFARLPTTSTRKTGRHIVGRSEAISRISLYPVSSQPRTLLHHLRSARLEHGQNSQEPSQDEEYKDVIRKYWRYRSRGEMFEELGKMGIDITTEEVNARFKDDQTKLLNWLVDEIAARVRKYSPRDQKEGEIDQELPSEREGSAYLMESLQEGIAVRKEKTKQTDEMRSMLARGAPRDTGYYP
eukprot:jgi/Bigna1/66859/fgenesh1_pg.2_\